MDNYNANIRVRDLPRDVDRILNTLASVKGKLKQEIIRDALVEYVENHRAELIGVLL